MNSLGIHALVWTEGWNEDDCRRAVALTKETGYDLIEIPLLDPSEVDAVMTRGVLEAAGLSASCSLGLGFDTDVSSADPAVSARGEELLERAIDVTSRCSFRMTSTGGEKRCSISALRASSRPTRNFGQVSRRPYRTSSGRHWRDSSRCSRLRRCRERTPSRSSTRPVARSSRSGG